MKLNRSLFVGIFAFFAIIALCTMAAYVHATVAPVHGSALGFVAAFGAVFAVGDLARMAIGAPSPFAAALGVRFIPLLTEDAALLDANREVILTHEDLTEATANTAQTIPLFTVEGLYMMVELVRAELLEAFQDTADAGNNSTAIEIGDGADTDRLLTATQVNLNGTEVYIKGGTGTRHVFSADDTVDALVAAPGSGKTLAALNRGKLRLLFRVFDARDAVSAR